MNSYHIQNTISGADLGTYQCATEAEALDAMARDAGYQDYADLQQQIPAQEGEILVEITGEAEDDD